MYCALSILILMCMLWSVTVWSVRIPSIAIRVLHSWMVLVAMMWIIVVMVNMWIKGGIHGVSLSSKDDVLL
jgi:hypothetical protein